MTLDKLQCVMVRRNSKFLYKIIYMLISVITLGAIYTKDLKQFFSYFNVFSCFLTFR